MNRIRIFEIKAFLLILFIIDGLFRGLFYFLCDSQLQEYRDRLSISEVGMYFFLVTFSFFAGTYLLSQFLPDLWRKNKSNIFLPFLPYFDFSWIWFGIILNCFTCGSLMFVRDIFHDVLSSLYFYGIGFLLILYGIALNYFFGSKFLDDQQKQYFLGAFINSKIDSFFHKSTM